MRQPCQHGRTLPRGLLCDRGYLSLRLWVNGKRYVKGYGPHAPNLEKIAIMALNKITEQRYFGSFELPEREVRRRFSEVADLVYKFKYENDPTRTPQGLYNGKVRFNQFKTFFGQYWFDSISAAEVLKWRGRRLKVAKFSTVNRDQRSLSAIFNDAVKLIETKQIARFKTPKINPCKSVECPSEEGLARDRVPSQEEMKQAKAWCFAHDRSLWDIIELLAITGRRKGELMRLKVGQPISGIQTKTGKKFKLPMRLDTELNWTNFDDRFDVLRQHMGWFYKKLEDGTQNPVYTVCHDLKHYGPTAAAERGFSDSMIQAFTQHSDPKMASRYTNPRTVAAVTDAIKDEFSQF